MVLAGLAIAWVLRSQDVAVAEVGRPAPDFIVPLMRGGHFSLSDQLDSESKPIVLNLWASWCEPCRVETPEISAFAEANPDVKVLGVAVEDVESASREFAEEFAPSYDLALGTAEFDEAYPRLGLPVTYVIAADGKVKHVFNGILDRGKLEELVSG